MIRVSQPLAMAMLLTVLCGCGQSSLRMPVFGSEGGGLQLQSTQIEDALLELKFDRATYLSQNRDTVLVVLTAGPPEALTHALTIRMFYTPRAGKTPLSEDAVNARFQYVLFADSPEGGQRLVGIYSGAGFVYPHQYPGSARIRLSAWQATMRLTDASEGFVDLLGQSRLQGAFNASRGDGDVLDQIRRINTQVSAHLGYPRLVQAWPETDAASRARFALAGAIVAGNNAWPSIFD